MAAHHVPSVPRLPALEWAAWRAPFVFFTGKGGVGKTTVASAVAVALADAGTYRERVIGPYRGRVSEPELREITEQLAGECTVEVAAFDRFTQLIVHPDLMGC